MSFSRRIPIIIFHINSITIIKNKYEVRLPELLYNTYDGLHKLVNLSKYISQFIALIIPKLLLRLFKFLLLKLYINTLVHVRNETLIQICSTPIYLKSLHHSNTGSTFCPIQNPKIGVEMNNVT